MTLPGLVRANNLNDVVDRERVWDNLGSSLATGDISIPAPSLDLNFASNKSLVDDISGNNLITFSRASTGTFVGSNGLIQTAASGVPRFDHNPTTGESLGLLVEEARINYVFYSQQFENGAWLKDGAGVISNTAVAPDGTLTADSLIENSGPQSTVIISQSGGNISASVFAKEIPGSAKRYLYIGIDKGSIGSDRWGYAIVDLATGSFVLKNNVQHSIANVVITSFPNGWKKISGYCSSSLDAKRFVIGLSNQANPTLASSSIPYTGDGASGIYIWGAQVELGSFPTSYIPTVASEVTRAADVAQIAGANFSSWYNQNEGTMLINSEKKPSNALYFGMSNANFRSALLPQRLNSTQLLVAANYNEINLYRSLSDTPRLKWAISFNPSSLRESANGSTVGSIFGTVTTNFDRLSVTGLPWEAGSSLGSTTISRFTYWPRNFPSQALQYISQLSLDSINLYAFNYAINGKDVLALNAVRNASTRDFIFIKGLLSAAQPRLTAAAATTSSGLTLVANALPKLAPSSNGNYFFASGLTLSGVTTRINGTNALSIATSPFSGSTATAPLLFSELRPQANWRITEPMPSGTIASPEFAIPFETNNFVLFMKAGQN